MARSSNSTMTASSSSHSNMANANANANASLAPANPWLQIAHLGNENAAFYERHLETKAEIHELLRKQAEKKAELKDLEKGVEEVREELKGLEGRLVERKVELGRIGEGIRGNSERLRGLQGGVFSAAVDGSRQGEEAVEGEGESEGESETGEDEEDAEDGGVALGEGPGSSPAVSSTAQQRQAVVEQEDTFEDILGIGNSFYSQPSPTTAVSSSRASAISDHAARPSKAPDRPREPRTETRSSLVPRARQPFAPGRPRPPKAPAYLNSYAPHAAAALQAGHYGPRHIRPERSPSPAAPSAPASANPHHSNATNRNLSSATTSSSAQSNNINKRKRMGNFTGGAADSALLASMQARIASTSAKAEKFLVPGRDRMPFGVEERDVVRPQVGGRGEGVGSGRRGKRRRGMGGERWSRDLCG
ncbi:hypothetical protein BST61_g2878 [Cercospora zeina]